MKTAFVTGGSGFVGRNLLRSLQADGVTTRALVRSASKADLVNDLGAEAVRGDLTDTEALDKGIEGCDVVFHCAAWVKDWGPRDEVWEANVVGTERVLAAAEKAEAKMIHVSTEAVLVGGGPIVQANEARDLPEKPIGLYPETKGQAELRVRAAAERGVDACIVRPRLIWGEGDTSVLPRIEDAVKQGRFAWIGGGEALTSTCHVRNVVEGLRLAAEKGKAGEAYFLTDGETLPFRDFISRLLLARGLTAPDRSIPLWLVKPVAALIELAWSTLPLSGEPPITRTAVRLVGEEVTVVDDKARNELGYLGKVTLDEGLSEMAKARQRAA